MGLFSRKSRSQRQPPIISGEAIARLPSVGQAVFRDGQIVDVSDYYLPGFMAAGSPLPSSSGWDAFTDRLLSELLAGAEATGGWGIAGAFHVAKDFIGVSEDPSYPTFQAITDQALRFMAGAGVATMHIPMGLLDRWHTLQRGD